MESFTRTLRRNRKNFKRLGWAACGFVLLFGILTLQLSATEGRSTNRSPVPARPTTTAPATFQMPTPDSRTLQSAAKPASRGSLIRITGDGQTIQAAHQVFVPSNGVEAIAPPSPYGTPSPIINPATSPYGTSSQIINPATSPYGTPSPIIDPATSSNAIYLQQPAEEVIYQRAQAVPSSNYFGVGPDDVCDEWSEFCDCEQKQFYRRGEVCSDKECRLKNRLEGRRGASSGCGR